MGAAASSHRRGAALSRKSTTSESLLERSTAIWDAPGDIWALAASPGAAIRRGADCAYRNAVPVASIEVTDVLR
jgi:hypothetical protein